MSGHTDIWIDGARSQSLPLPDRGLDFGDGVFETFLVHQGQPLFVNYHLDRLRFGVQALGMTDCLEIAESQLANAVSAMKHEGRWASLRLSIVRGPGPRGYAPAESSKPRILIYVTSLNRDCARLDQHAELCVADIRLAIQPLLARIKHLNRLEQIMAAVQAHKQAADEAILYDQAGYLTSVIAGNIFLVSKGELLTPQLVECGIVGTRRRRIIEKWAPAIGMRVKETRLRSADLHDAEEVFYSNSLLTVRPIAKIGNMNWKNHEVCKALFQEFLKELS